MLRAMLVCLSLMACGASSDHCVQPADTRASPEGGCCSEWIQCASGLSCEADGPVYPGSLGICRKSR
jgi:hypothetical protein